MCRMHHIRQYPLKLIGHANRDNIIIIDVQIIIAIQLVYFIINKCRHIFVEIIRSTNIDIIDQIFITDAFNIFPFDKT